ncbi:hypothetical protein LWP59_31105 [Amycolatopsis acidiphila]|uniref:NERD domain-containing protein n=1 Tax=Amycolatopsis acidiphila TaxID=715473 RepID=A0A558AJY6_9PSEU|nr:hypothetical protein [Amycolatopsis acidiphila]TVT24576.1 hypothetical protein FNH06_06295 [Amycolatopsis acidiphila]UIJ58520.1 hypothetical protein LWP59_31105 [Amycolatopsis acidiphila]GHG77033.1 hypothetical protein GCM10017788_43060 [Amycolatopsis acidiphila]
MRLVRLGQQPSRVAEDIRAALASLGRGATVVGGVALVGARPIPSVRSVDAVVVLPRGVLVVLGVDLPEPAMRLEAPLAGPWKADGWPLPGPDKAVNPATPKLALAESITRHLRPKVPAELPIGTILAVGPFVDEVDQPPADVSGPVRVLHPTATHMLAATVSLAAAPKPCSVEEARLLLKALAPEAPPLSDEILAAEGFGVIVEQTAEKLATPETTDKLVPSMAASEKTEKMAPPSPPWPRPKTPPPPAPIEMTTPVPRITAAVPVRAPAMGNPRTVRWLPLAAIGLLAVLLVTAIVLATTSGGDPEGAPAPPPQVVDGIPLIERAAATDGNCAAHAVGDLQASLQRTACVTMRRGSFEATVDGRLAAVSIAMVTFADSTAASAFKKAADTPGGGGVTDLAGETGKWARTPHFDGTAAYVSAASGTEVRLVLAAWFDQPSTADDPSLLRAAHAGATARIP